MNFVRNLHNLTAATKISLQGSVRTMEGFPCTFQKIHAIKFFA